MSIKKGKIFPSSPKKKVVQKEWKFWTEFCVNYLKS